MSIYELPDGFEGMETAPKDETVNLVSKSGRYYVNSYPFGEGAIGWAPIVPPKKKRRFVVVKSSEGWCHNAPFMIRDNVSTHIVSNRIPTSDAAQRIADIYNEVMP